MHRSFSPALALFALLAAAAAQLPSQAPAAPIQIKVVVVAMFEVGADTGDTPGELQYWVERDHLDRTVDVPGSGHPVRINDAGEMAILTGMGPTHSAATLMAVALDPRFDLSHAYWLIAGISGADPERATLASAAWARWVVDGDLGYELDAREIPSTWPTGAIPLHKSSPYEAPPEPFEGQVFALNPDLADWAFALTKSVELKDSPEMAAMRANYDGAAAQRAPFVLEGDELASARYWHGEKMSAWAHDWLAYFTNGKGIYVTSAMEDSGTLESLHRLADSHRLDWKRVLVLRTVSNFDRQPKGLTAYESLQKQRASKSPGYIPSLENAYRVGHTVVAELLTHWEKYSAHAPGI